MTSASFFRNHRPRHIKPRLQVEPLEDRLTPSTTWVEQGPGPIVGGATQGIPDSPVAGAIEAIAVDPTNADVVYAGSVNGGVWKTTNATAANPIWTPLTDLQLPEISIDSLAISPVNSNTLFAGTGSTSSFFAYGSPGIGVARSMDGGASWTVLGSDIFAGQRIRRVVPTTLGNGNVILVATEFAGHGEFGLTAAKGLYRSIDNGASFVRISGGAGTGLPDQEVSDLVADPSNPSRFYAAVPVPNRAAPTGHEGIYKSEDGGLTWSVMNNGLPALDSTYRIFLSVHNSPGHDVIYAMLISDSPLQLQGVFRSADQGATWAAMGVPNMNFFPNGNDLTGAILADRQDANVVYISGDSGSGNAISILFRGDFSQNNPWSSLLANDCNGMAPHGDSRAMVFDPNDNILQGNDGGLYRLVDPSVKAARHWVSVNGNLGTTEFHSVGYDPVSNIILGGSQDNGNSEQTTPGSLTWNGFQTGGDGGDVAVDSDQTIHPGTSIRYSSYDSLANFNRRTVDANNVAGHAVRIGLKIVAGDGKGKELRAFDPNLRFYQPFVLNAVDPRRMLIGTKNLYESMDQGDTLNDLEFTGAYIGGNEGFGTSWGMPMAYGSRLNGVSYPDVFYVSSGANPDLFGSGTHLLHRVHLGDPIRTLTAYPGDAASVAVDPQDYRRVYTTDGNNRVWASFDEGATWRELTANLHDLTNDVSGRTIEIYSTSPSPDEDVVLVGNLGGVFAMFHPDQPGATWTRLGDGLPHVQVLDLHYDYTDSVLLAGTLGRGAWTLDNPFSSGGSAPASVEAATEAVDPSRTATAVQDRNLSSGDPLTAADFKNPPSPIGTTFSTAANVNTDVEGAFHNETSIAVNPTNPLNMIGGANDFQGVLHGNGAELFFTGLARARVTFDGGLTWSAPAAIQAPNDQFQPWGAYDAGGRLQIGYYDRSYDPSNHKYGYSLASESIPGSLNFTTQQVTTALSDPTQGDAFNAVTANGGFPGATTFIGDYSGIAVTPTGVAALWTDLRLPSSTFPGNEAFPGSGEDAFFALVDPPALPVAGPVQITISDVMLLEGDSGLTPFVFTVTLSTASSQPLTAADGSPTAGQDYAATNETLTFAADQTTQTITVLVKADKIKQSDEAFFLNLSAGINALIVDSQGLGTILSDDLC
jgi:hypothetical protein